LFVSLNVLSGRFPALVINTGSKFLFFAVEFDTLVAVVPLIVVSVLVVTEGTESVRVVMPPLAPFGMLTIYCC
ncbi:hypothetical protein AB8S30_26765, partial [Klebsiella pneumoniae]